LTSRLRICYEETLAASDSGEMAYRDAARFNVDDRVQADQSPFGGKEKMDDLERLSPLVALLREIQQIESASALLAWDQETYMPHGGGAARAEQLAALQGLAHGKMVSDQMAELLSRWLDLRTGTPLETTRWKTPALALLREIWRDYLKAKKLPTEFVIRLERETSLAHQVWVEARKKNDFALFLPRLSTIIALKREEARYLGETVPGAASPYDPLLDEYEPGARVDQITPLFATLRARLVPLLERIRSKRTGAHRFFRGEYPPDRQLAFGKEVLRAMGFDFEQGRMDLSAHPFTTMFHPSDVRVTTRVEAKDPTGAIFSCIHEGGHALYDQGLSKEHFGTPLGDSISLGIHESQSRLWENCVGRSLPFWKHFFPTLKKAFPKPLRGVTVQQFYRAINVVRPSFIRVDADELTYNLHIMLRYELERGLIEGGTEAEKLPSLWKDGMGRYLGIRPKKDSDGVLQDVHWAAGAIGYFPTYTLGNLYAVQFFEQANKEIPGLTKKIERGELIPLKSWLNEKIHRWGRTYRADELIQRVTGGPLSPEPFIRYIEEKYGEIYRL
jgi:carboxypeptidase Taq